jgi:hypothetical protein
VDNAIADVSRCIDCGNGDERHDVVLPTLDYSICIRPSREKEKLQWELLPLSRWEGPNLVISAIALRTLSDDGAKEEGGFMLRSAAL